MAYSRDDRLTQGQLRDALDRRSQNVERNAQFGSLEDQITMAGAQGASKHADFQRELLGILDNAPAPQRGGGDAITAFAESLTPAQKAKLLAVLGD